MDDKGNIYLSPLVPAPAVIGLLKVSVKWLFWDRKCYFCQNGCSVPLIGDCVVHWTTTLDYLEAQTAFLSISEQLTPKRCVIIAAKCSYCEMCSNIWKKNGKNVRGNVAWRSIFIGTSPCPYWLSTERQVAGCWCFVLMIKITTLLFALSFPYVQFDMWVSGGILRSTWSMCDTIWRHSEGNLRLAEVW